MARTFGFTAERSSAAKVSGVAFDGIVRMDSDRGVDEIVLAGQP